MKVLVIFFIITFLPSCNNNQTQNKTNQDKIKVIQKNIIEPHAPWNKNHNQMWEKNFTKVTKEQNYNLMKKVFEISKKTDGIFSTQYSLDLFEIYKKNPVFFVKSAAKYYNGNYTHILKFWINEVGDITLDDIKKHSKKVSNNSFIIKFIKQAEILNTDLFKNIYN